MPKHQFCLKKRSSEKKEQFVADENCSIWEAVKDYILQETSKSVNSKNTIIFLASMQDIKDGKKYWVPYFLPCGFVKSNSFVEWDIVQSKKADITQVIPTKTLDCTLVFVTPPMKHQTRITHVDYHTQVGHDIDMCVVANRKQSFQEAFTEDGRFKQHSEKWHYKYVLKGKDTQANISVELKPLDMSSGTGYVDVFVTVERKKDRNSEQSGANLSSNNQTLSSRSLKSENPVTSQSPPSSSTNAVPPGSSTSRDGMTGAAHHIYELTEKILQEGKIYPFTQDLKKLSMEEIYQFMFDCRVALTWFKLVGDNAKEFDEREFTKAIENTFAKAEITNTNRSVSFSKKICSLYNSVGKIKSGTVVATCFLVSPNVIVTNWHVLDLILKDRENKRLEYDYSKVKVNFDYEEDGKEESSDLFYVLELEWLFNQKLDYAFFELDRNAKSDERSPLGDRVRRTVPSTGFISIVGHPDGKIKQEEFCAIVPLSERPLEVEKRYRENVQAYGDPLKQSFNYKNLGQCLGYFNGLEKLCCDENKISYDVGSFFGGSSGSPIFDMQCNIVGIHSGGFSVDNSSIIEFGISFEAIINDLKQHGHSDFLNKTFPNCNHGVTENKDMEVDVNVN